MKRLRLLLTMIIVLAAVGVQAQNTGTSPYVNSTHTYSITKGMTTGSSLNWTVPSGMDSGGVAFADIASQYSITSGGGNSVNVEIKWLTAGTYILHATETATSGACPTIREIEVVVVDNDFDVIASLVLDPDAIGGNDYEKVDCATVLNPVDDNGTASNLSDDNFGTTTRVFNVNAEGLAPTVKWNFTYSIVHAAESDLGLYDVVVESLKVEDETANPLVVNAGVTDVRITVTYQTNKIDQDASFDLVLNVSAVTDENGTPEKGAGNNTDTYTINAVPATTGIVTD